MFLWPVALQIKTQTQPIPSRFDPPVGCCVVVPPPATGRRSIPIEHDDVLPTPLLCLLINCSDAAPQTLRIRKRVDC